jgi:hypothetical protein
VRRLRSLQRGAEGERPPRGVRTSDVDAENPVHNVSSLSVLGLDDRNGIADDLLLIASL